MWSYKTVIMVVGTALALGAAGCGPLSDKKEAEERAAGAAVAPRQSTYLKIQQTAAEDTVYADTTLLRLLSQDGVHVYGSYFWRPPGKDERTGAISGVRDKDTVAGIFSYRQEGGNYRDSVRIVFAKTRVIITQISPEGYSIADTLAGNGE